MFPRATGFKTGRGPAPRLRLRWNHQAWSSRKSVFPLALAFAILPFLRGEIRFGCPRRACLGSYRPGGLQPRAPFAVLLCAAPLRSATTTHSRLPEALPRARRERPSKRSKAPRFKTSAQSQSSARREATIRLGRSATRSSPVSRLFQSPSGSACSQITTGISRRRAASSSSLARSPGSLQLPVRAMKNVSKCVMILVTGADQQDDAYWYVTKLTVNRQHSHLASALRMLRFYTRCSVFILTFRRK